MYFFKVKQIKKKLFIFGSILNPISRLDFRKHNANFIKKKERTKLTFLKGKIGKRKKFGFFAPVS